MIRRRRKRDENNSNENENKEDEEENHLSDQIKKVKISTTPGDLRLQKDLQDFQGINSIELLSAGEKSCIILNFTHLPQGYPHTYHIRVPKLYPHDPPIVTCLNHGFISEFIDQTGKVTHPNLGGNWTAINSMINVAEILQEISASIHV